MPESITLPWPPSNNVYYRHNRGRTHISEHGIAYRNKVWQAVRKARMQPVEPYALSFGDARLHVIINCYPPDKRKRDLDNICKSVFDSLTKAKVWSDDSQIDHLEVVRCDVSKCGMLIVSIAIYGE